MAHEKSLESMATESDRVMLKLLQLIFIFARAILQVLGRISLDINSCRSSDPDLEGGAGVCESVHDIISSSGTQRIPESWGS